MTASPSGHDRDATKPAGSSAQPVLESGTFLLGDRVVNRLGFGAMRLTGPGIWGEPAHRIECIRVLRRALELGVNLIDTADSYGPEVSEDLIYEALHPYPDELVIATKAGLTRAGPDLWAPVGRPEYLRQECEMSLRRLRVDRLDLFQLHRIDPKVPVDEQFGVLAELRSEGKVAEVGLSNVGTADIDAARRQVPIVTVQNQYNLAHRDSEDVLDHCAALGIGFIPWAPIAGGSVASDTGPLGEAARELGATPSQVGLAWLLQHSPVMLPIPGTSTVRHLEENVAAATLRLNDEQVRRINALSE
jgi:pyridoxine 4-dehydrogenase